jgi:hypothetical protein
METGQLEAAKVVKTSQFKIIYYAFQKELKEKKSLRLDMYWVNQQI